MPSNDVMTTINYDCSIIGGCHSGFVGELGLWIAPVRVSTLVTVSGVQSRPLWGEAPFRLRGPGTRVMSVVGMVSGCGYRTGGGAELGAMSSGIVEPRWDIDVYEAYQQQA